MPVSTYEHQPRDVQQALTEFRTELNAALALGGVEQWATEIGQVIQSSALQVTLPIAVRALKYRLRKGDDKLVNLFERSISLKWRAWQVGVEEEADKITALDWAPADMALETMRMPNVLAADVLAQNPLLDFYRHPLPGGDVAPSIRLFAANHPVHVFDESYGTFDNHFDAGDTVQGIVLSDALDTNLVKALRKHFRSIKGANGRSLGLRLGGLIITTKYEEDAADLFERDTVLEAISNAGQTDFVGGVTQKNRFAGTKYIVAEELTGDLPSGETGDEDTIYAFGVKQVGKAPPPWAVFNAGEERISYGPQDSKYKDEGKVAEKNVLRLDTTAVLPHAIARIDLSPA
jgi:hypothetical protein